MSEHIVDAHAHIYSADEVRYPMIDKPHRPPTGTGDIEHLRRERDAHGVHRVVLVQTGSAYKWDNRLVTDTARENPDWTTGVCNLNPADPDSPDRFEAMVRDDNIRALRLEPAPDGRFDHEGSRALLDRTQQIGAAICAHLQAAALPELDALLSAHPDVPVVLDHCAYPDGAAGPDGATVQDVVALARHPNLYAKLTFMVTRSVSGDPFDDTRPIARRIIDAFGPARCMWGSDFPCELWLKDLADYERHLAVVRDDLGLNTKDRAEVLGGTAMRVFFPGQ
ncbi:MAG: amidohydrolase family protein [Gemmatimonadetes bacterium]|jgi:predicted TIM-barrel fold metal-dependent hydrolase|nr:amidohydrolase family protein [Gemmatimonadota bacterium]MBT6148328.1 amidohydrolase family protein [Gemmatimonadota bacterium]